jgi:hypothetical protein
VKMLVDVLAHERRQREVDGRVDGRCRLEELVRPKVGDRGLDRDDIGLLAGGVREDLLVKRLRKQLDPDRVDPWPRRVWTTIEVGSARTPGVSLTVARPARRREAAPSVTMAWPSSLSWRTDG